MGGVIGLSAAAADDAVCRHIVGLIAYGPYIDFHTSLRGRLGAAGLPTRPFTNLAMWWFRLPHKEAASCSRAPSAPVIRLP